MYTPTTLQAPRIHKMRPRLCAIGHKVNPFLNASPFHSRETWLLLQARTLCILRYTRGNHGEPKEQGQACAEAWKRRRKKSQLLQAPDIRPQPGHPPHQTANRPPSKKPSVAHTPAPGCPASHEGPDIRPDARTSGPPACVQLIRAESHVPLRPLDYIYSPTSS